MKAGTVDYDETVIELLGEEEGHRTTEKKVKRQVVINERAITKV